MQTTYTLTLHGRYPFGDVEDVGSGCMPIVGRKLAIKRVGGSIVSTVSDEHGVWRWELPPAIDQSYEQQCEIALPGESLPRRFHMPPHDVDLSKLIVPIFRNQAGT